jgi:hypothetical protein
MGLIWQSWFGEPRVNSRYSMQTICQDSAYLKKREPHKRRGGDRAKVFVHKVPARRCGPVFSASETVTISVTVTRVLGTALTQLVGWARIHLVPEGRQA